MPEKEAETPVEEKEEVEVTDEGETLEEEEFKPYKYRPRDSMFAKQ